MVDGCTRSDHIDPIETGAPRDVEPMLGWCWAMQGRRRWANNNPALFQRFVLFKGKIQHLLQINDGSKSCVCCDYSFWRERVQPMVSCTISNIWNSSQTAWYSREFWPVCEAQFVALYFLIWRKTSILSLYFDIIIILGGVGHNYIQIHFWEEWSR